MSCSSDQVQYYNLMPQSAGCDNGAGGGKEPRRPPRSIDNNVDSFLVDHSYYNLPPVPGGGSPAPPRLPKRRPNTSSTLVRGDSCRSAAAATSVGTESGCQCKSGKLQT